MRNSNKLAGLVIIFVTFFLLALPVIAATPAPSVVSPDSSRISPEDVPPPPSAITPEQGDVYSRAQVISIIAEGTKTVDQSTVPYQKVKLKILNGPENNKNIIIDNGGEFSVGQYQRVSVGDVVVIAKPVQAAKPDFYYIIDIYRTPKILLIVGLFVALAIFFGRTRGFTSLIGMLFSVVAIFYFIIPRILHGGDPFMTSLIGSVIIILFSLYLSHGFNKRTTIALTSTLAALALAIGIDLLFVRLAHLMGNGTEESFYLQFGSLQINLQGLLMGGIIIGVLGVLDDVTTGQVAAIEEIHTAAPSLRFRALYKKGLSVGREHIASLVNTLVLAYVGASFPLLLLATTQKAQPLWLIFNSNFISEEIVRTLVGSSVLILAVPLTTLCAAYYYARQGSAPR